jgi:hypothetical protein
LPNLRDEGFSAGSCRELRSGSEVGGLVLRPSPFCGESGTESNLLLLTVLLAWCLEPDLVGSGLELAQGDG